MDVEPKCLHIFGDGLSHFLRHRVDLTFCVAKSPHKDGMSFLGCRGASSLPWPHFNFLTDVNKLKEIRVAEGVGGGNGMVDGIERCLRIKMDRIGSGGGRGGALWAGAQARFE